MNVYMTTIFFFLPIYTTFAFGWCCLEPYGHCAYQFKITGTQYALVNDKGIAQQTYKKNGKEICSKCNHEVLSHLCDKSGIPVKICTEIDDSRAR